MKNLLKSICISLIFISSSFLFPLYFCLAQQGSPNAAVVELVNKGIEFHRNKDFESALRTFQEALSLEPTNKTIKDNISIAHNNYGKYLAERTDTNKAIKEFRLALFYNTENMTASSNLESVLLQQGYKTKDPVVRKEMGDKLRQEAEFECALSEYRIAKSLSTKPNPDILIAAGDIHYILYLREGQKSDDIKQALDAYKLSLSINESAKAHVKVGDALLGLRDVVGAIEHYKKAAELEPTNSEVQAANVRGWNEAVRLAPLIAENHIGLASALQMKKDFTAAEDEYKQALKLNPNSAEAKNGLASLAQDKQTSSTAIYLDLGLKLQSSGKYDDAIKEYIKALQISPNDSKIHYNIGTAFQAKNNLDHAEKAYRKALDVDPNNTKAKQALDNLTKQVKSNKVDELLSRAVELQNNGNYQEAITTYQAASSLDPNNAQIYYNIGTAYQASNDFQKAKENYNKALSFDTSNTTYKTAIQGLNAEQATPLIKSAIDKQNANDISGAITDYKKALEYVPNDAQTHFNLATAYQTGNQSDNAILSYKKSYELDPSGQADALFFIGSIYEEKNDNKNAIINYQNYLNKAPTGSYAKDAKDHINYLKSKKP